MKKSVKEKNDMAGDDKAIVFDSWAILALLGNEPGGKKAAEEIIHANQMGLPLYMTVINAGEIWYITARELSARKADEVITEIENLRIEIVMADWELTFEAAKYKAMHKMSYADCFAAALAKRQNARLLTGDREFEQVAGEIEISWLSG